MPTTPDDIKSLVEANAIILFTKGTKDAPMCGFSARAIEVFRQLEVPFEVVNIFDDPSIRPSLVAHSGWPTTPQIFVAGELIGGSDIALELYESGELQDKVATALAT